MSSINFSLPSPVALPEIAAQATTWARQAGQIALSYFNKNNDVHYKEDKTFVTQADLEIEQFLIEQIGSAYPDHSLLSEEGTDKRVDSPYIWAIDPLDGSSVFVQGLPGWGISIGLLHQSQPVFGLFYMPLLTDLTYAFNDKVYYNEHLLENSIRADWSYKGFLATSTTAHRDFEIDKRIRAIGSVGASLVYTARGSATAALIPKAYVWDLAAGAMILNRAGGELCYLSGSPVDLRTLLDGRLAPEPIIAGHPEVLEELQSTIRPR